MAAVRRVANDPASVAVWTMSLDMAAAEAEGSALGDAAGVAAGLGVGATVASGLGDAAVEQAAIAMASAGRSRAMDRFMTDGFPSDSGLDVQSALADCA